VQTVHFVAERKEVRLMKVQTTLKAGGRAVIIDL